MRASVLFLVSLCCLASASPLLRAQMSLQTDDDNQAQIAKLLQKALDETDPAEQIRIYKQILELDPNNQNAFNGIRAAQDKIDNSRKQADQRDEERRKQEQQQESDTQKQNQAIADANAALDRNDPNAAASALEIAKRIGLANPEISGIAARISAMQYFRQRLEYAAFGFAVALVGIVVAFIVGFRGKRVPYVEALDGPLAGKRFEISKTPMLVGSVGDYGGGANDIVLTDPDGMIAEAQCEIHEKNGKYYLLDCGSPHGTAADGKPVTPDRPAPLKSGSRIDLAGVWKLRFGFERKK
jgi:hypothetical protein